MNQCAFIARGFWVLIMGKVLGLAPFAFMVNSVGNCLVQNYVEHPYIVARNVHHHASVTSVIM